MNLFGGTDLEVTEEKPNFLTKAVAQQVGSL